MKKFFVYLLAAYFLATLFSCDSQKVYSDFDYSYARQGGLQPTYENFLIKGNKAHYSFEGQGKDIKKDFKISDEEIAQIENALSANNFRKIRENYKKIYDHLYVTINVKKGKNSGSKTDASTISKGDQKKWENIEQTFRKLIDSKLNAEEIK